MAGPTNKLLIRKKHVYSSHTYALRASDTGSLLLTSLRIFALYRDSSVARSKSQLTRLSHLRLLEILKLRFEFTTHSSDTSSLASLQLSGSFCIAFARSSLRHILNKQKETDHNGLFLLFKWRDRRANFLFTINMFMTLTPSHFVLRIQTHYCSLRCAYSLCIATLRSLAQTHIVHYLNNKKQTQRSVSIV